QTRSTINRPQRQKLTIRALRLGKIGKSVQVELTPQVQGMIRRVGHLIKTEPV
ncbi:MAG: 50S ribosomal protein L30, partial [Bacteroidota bacterium]